MHEPVFGETKEKRALKDQVNALLKSVADISAQRDRYFKMKCHNADTVSKLRYELQNFKHKARPLIDPIISRGDEDARNDLVSLVTDFVQD